MTEGFRTHILKRCFIQKLPYMGKTYKLWRVSKTSLLLLLFVFEACDILWHPGTSEQESDSRNSEVHNCTHHTETWRRELWVTPRSRPSSDSPQDSLKFSDSLVPTFPPIPYQWVFLGLLSHFRACFCTTSPSQLLNCLTSFKLTLFRHPTWYFTTYK